MINIQLQWNDFDVDLVSLEKKMREDHTSYVGNSAHSSLDLFFEADSLTDNEIQDIKLWFKQDLNEENETAKRALPSRSIDAAEALIKAEKEAILLIEDISTLTEVQKKVWMNMDLSNDEIDSLA